MPADVVFDRADTLIYSDDPETLSASVQGITEGVLYSARVAGGQKRVCFYHVDADATPRTIAVRLLNIGSAPAIVRRMSFVAPLGGTWNMGGHLAAAGFLRALLGDNWTQDTLAPQSSIVCASTAVANSQLAVGFVELQLPSGAAMQIDVVAAADPNRTTDVANAGKRVRPDGHGRCGVYSLLVPDVQQITHVLGGSPTTVPAPGQKYVNLRPPADLAAGKQSIAYYGFFSHVQLTLNNTNATDAVAWLYATASGGDSTGTFLIDGDVIEAGEMQSGSRPPRPRYKLRSYTVLAGASVTSAIATTIDPSSFAPITLTVDADDHSAAPGSGIVFIPGGNLWRLA
jgi:hypothetical protein